MQYKTTADKIVSGTAIHAHIPKWNGFYRLQIVLIQSTKDKITMIAATGNSFIFNPEDEVWISDYQNSFCFPEQPEFILTVFSPTTNYYRSISSVYIESINHLMESKKDFPSDALYVLETIQKGFVLKGERDIVDNWKPHLYHWFKV